MRLLSVVATGVALLLSAACSDKSNDPLGPSQSEAAIRGRTAARAMMGLAATPQIPSGALGTQAREYEAVAAHMLDVLEREQPGVFDRFGAELGARDAKRSTLAWVGMRRQIDSLADSAQVIVDVRSDATFKSARVQTIDLRGGLSLADDPSGDGAWDLGRGPDGFYGDGKMGPGQAAADIAGLYTDITPLSTLAEVDKGTLVPDPDSRLGAYACTRGYGPSTVGQAVHNAIGVIYDAFATYGEEKIGRVFCDPRAKALFGDPLDSDSSLKMAAIEVQYWANVAAEDPFSAGGHMGAMFSPSVRDFLQQHVFGQENAGPSAGTGGAAGNDGGTTAMTAPDCSDKKDGWYCFAFEQEAGWMTYCSHGQISSGCPCAACKGTKDGTVAACTSDPDVCTSN